MEDKFVIVFRGKRRVKVAERHESGLYVGRFYGREQGWPDEYSVFAGETGYVASFGSHKRAYAAMQQIAVIDFWFDGDDGVTMLRPKNQNNIEDVIAAIQNHKGYVLGEVWE